MKILGFEIKASKPGTPAKTGSSTSPAYQDPPQNDMFKAYIPNFLYKPPFGYPLNKNVLHLKQLAKNPFVFSVIRTLKDEACTTKWEIKLKKEYAKEAMQQPQKPGEEEPVATDSEDEDSLVAEDESPETKAFGKEDETEDINEDDNTLENDTEDAITAETAFNPDSEIQRISNWFYNPNGNEESFNDIIGQWVQDICEVDAAVGIKVFDKSGKFSQLFARDGGSILKNPDIYGYLGNRDEIVYPYGDINLNLTTPYNIKVYSAAYAETAAYYQYGWTGNALPVPFGRREVIYIMSNPRTDGIYGRSPLEIIEDVLLTLVYGTAYNTDFYLNGNMPDGMINLVGADTEITKAFQDRMKDKFKTSDQLLGNSRRMGHQYPVYGGPSASFIPFNLSAKDMEIIEQQKWFTKLVWSAFGVTPDEMGYTEDSNKAVSQTQTTVHKRKALRPLLKKIEYAINSQIMIELDPSGKFEFAFEDYDLDEELKKAQLYQAQISGGWKTAEMVAEEEGIDVSKIKAQKTEDSKRKLELAKQNSPGMFGVQSPQQAFPGAKASIILKPFADYTDFDDCVAKNHHKSDPKAYCATIMRAVEGKSSRVKASKYVEMNLDELVAEHKKLVDVLENGTDEELKKEAEEQTKELEEYIKKKRTETKSVVKAEDKDDIAEYFSRVRKHLLEQIEKEDGNHS